MGMMRNILKVELLELESGMVKKMEWCVKGGERETGNVFSVS